VEQTEFKIDPKTAEEFLQAMKEMKRIGQRDGAIRWNLLRDSADPDRYVEVLITAEQYIIESAWEAQWLLEYVKSARTLERQPRA